MKQEIWKDVVGYEKLYLVSNLGRLKRLESIVKHPTGADKKCRERILQNKGEKPYLQFTLCKNGHRANLLMHRIVATAFLPNQENKPCVNHIDGNPRNNAVSNLEWATYSENELHSYKALGKVGTLSNLVNYESGWDSPLSVNGYNIRGSARKRAYELLKTGITIDDLAANKITLSSFYKLVMFLRRKGVNIQTTRISDISLKVKYLIV